MIVCASVRSKRTDALRRNLIHYEADEATRDIISRSVHDDLSEAAEQMNLPGVG